MAKAKPETETTEAPVMQEAATGLVIDTTGATDGVEADKPLPSMGDGATADAVVETTAINDAAFDEVMKRFVSQGKTVVVKGPEKGRWRAGRHFTLEPTSIPLVDLTEADLEKLCDDPLLTVAVIDAPY